MRSSRYLPSVPKQIRECVLPSRFLVLLDLLAKGPLSITGGACNDKEREVIGCGGGFFPEMLSLQLSLLKDSLNMKSEPRLLVEGFTSAVSEAVGIKTINLQLVLN